MKKSIYTLLIMFLCLASGYSQQQVEGTVVDMTNNETLIGVNVRIKGSSAGCRHRHQWQIHPYSFS
jgi:hypothetical protein